MQFSLHEKSQVSGERAFLDLSSIQLPARLPALQIVNSRIIIDECTNFKISHFFHRKDQMAEAMCKFLKAWKERTIITKFTNMDNAGENKLFNQRLKSKDWQLGLQADYTLRDTPQHNHLAELALRKLATKGRALLVFANVPWRYHFHLYR